VTVAANKKTLKRRVDDYLWRDESKTVQNLRSILHQHFWDFDNVAVIGGMVRDLGRKGVSGFKSDVDLVIDAPEDDVAKLAQLLGARANQFGGFGFQGARWKIDFWALETTWALRAGHISVTSLEDLIQGTFFDWDAVLYELKSRRIMCTDEYIATLNSGLLGLNLRATPSSIGNAVRAIRRIIEWDVCATEGLIDFVDEVLGTEGLGEITRYEKERYTNSITSFFGSRDQLVYSLHNFDERHKLGTQFARQLMLPGLLD
jgi:hypothetical protein